MTPFLLPLALLAADTLPKRGEPPLTEQTKRSGGAIDPEQAKLRFDAAATRSSSRLPLIMSCPIPPPSPKFASPRVKPRWKTRS